MGYLSIYKLWLEALPRPEAEPLLERAAADDEGPGGQLPGPEYTPGLHDKIPVFSDPDPGKS